MSCKNDVSGTHYKSLQDASKAVKRNQEELVSLGAGLTRETTNPQSTCDDRCDGICHVLLMAVGASAAVFPAVVLALNRLSVS